MEKGIPQTWWKSGPVLQLHLSLRGDASSTPARPGDQAVGIAGFDLRPLQGGREQTAWLALMNAAFPRRRRPWAMADLQAELVRRTWWSPLQTQIAFGSLPWVASPDVQRTRRSPGFCAGNEGDADATARPLGTVTLELDRAAATARLHWLAVQPEARQQGVGRALVHWAARSARSGGAQFLRAETLQTWTNTLQFYYQLGFRLRDEPQDAQPAGAPS